MKLKSSNKQNQLYQQGIIKIKSEQNDQFKIKFKLLSQQQTNIYQSISQAFYQNHTAMQYLNQTIVFMSEENKELKEKVRRLQQICKNITQTHNVVLENNYSKVSINTNNTNNDIDQWQLSSPKSTNNQYSLKSSKQQTKLVNFHPTTTTYQSSTFCLGSTPILTLQKQVHSLKQQLALTTTQLHQTQLQSLNKTNKIKELSSHLTKANDQINYLKKQILKQKQNLKLFYETTLIQEIKDNFESQRKQQLKEITQQRQLMQTELRHLRIQVQSQQKTIADNHKQLIAKHAKQQRLLNIINDLKLLLQSSSQQHQQEIQTLSNLLQQRQSQLTQLKLSYGNLSDQNQQKQHQQDILQFQVKKLIKQITFIKRQHERSLSKTQRQLQRQKSTNKNIQKQYSMQRKILQAQLKKKQSNQNYHIKQQKQLINKIKTIQNQKQSILLSENNSKSHLDLSSLSSLDMTRLDISTRKSNYQAKSPISRLNISNRVSIDRKSSKSPFNHNKNSETSVLRSPNEQDEKPCFELDQKPCFSKYLQASPLSVNQPMSQQQQLIHNQNTKQRMINTTNTPKSVVKLKANTISLINNSKHRQPSLTVTARTNKQSTPSTARRNHDSQNNMSSNNTIISLKDAKYHNQTVTEFSLTPQDNTQDKLSHYHKENHYDKQNTSIHESSQNATIKNSNNNSPSLRSEESLQINNYSSIDILKDNLSYFPSNKTSIQNSPHKTFLPFESQNHNLINDQSVQDEIQKRSQENKLSFNEHIEELRKLQHYMRTSFNPNHKPQIYTHNRDIGHKTSEQIKIDRTKSPELSQFNTVYQNSSQTLIKPYIPNRQTAQRPNGYTALNKEMIRQQLLINKLLQTQESNQKHKQPAKNTISIPKTKKKPQQIQELLASTQRHYRAHNQQQQLLKYSVNDPFSFVSIVESSQKPTGPIQSKRSIPNLSLIDNTNESLYKPNKDLMKLTDLDTPCFQSSSSINLSINSAQTGKYLINDRPTTLITPRQNPKAQRKMAINISNLNQIQINSKNRY